MKVSYHNIWGGQATFENSFVTSFRAPRIYMGHAPREWTPSGYFFPR